MVEDNAFTIQCYKTRFYNSKRKIFIKKKSRQSDNRLFDTHPLAYTCIIRACPHWKLFSPFFFHFPPTKPSDRVFLMGTKNMNIEFSVLLKEYIEKHGIKA